MDVLHKRVRLLLRKEREKAEYARPITQTDELDRRGGGGEEGGEEGGGGGGEGGGGDGVAIADERPDEVRPWKYEVEAAER